MIKISSIYVCFNIVSFFYKEKKTIYVAIMLINDYLKSMPISKAQCAR